MYVVFVRSKSMRQPSVFVLLYLIMPCSHGTPHSYNAQAHVSGGSRKDSLPNWRIRRFVVPIVLTSIIKLWSKRRMNEGANEKCAGRC